MIDALYALSLVHHSPVETRSVDMGCLAKECCEELEAAGWSVPWTLEALPVCDTDPSLVRQIWANLLSNAFKYSSSGTSPRVRIWHEVRSDGTWYIVTDNGPGFEPSQASRMFSIFQRLHTGPIEGLGIGLSTVRRVLQRLEGAIEATGIPGQGAEFRFRPHPGNSSPTMTGCAATVSAGAPT